MKDMWTTRKGKPVSKNKVNIKVDNMNQISVRKKSGRKKGMSGHNEERGTGRDPWETQPGRKGGRGTWVREEKERLL